MGHDIGMDCVQGVCRGQKLGRWGGNFLSFAPSLFKMQGRYLLFANKMGFLIGGRPGIGRLLPGRAQLWFL